MFRATKDQNTPQLLVNVVYSRSFVDHEVMWTSTRHYVRHRQCIIIYWNFK